MEAARSAACHQRHETRIEKCLEREASHLVWTGGGQLYHGPDNEIEFIIHI